MNDVIAGASEIARTLLEDRLPRRWAHTHGVAARARRLAAAFGEDAGLLEAAAWLHDIGYAPALVVTGFHPLDGARYLRDVHRADDVLCGLVAYHSCAVVEAQGRGLDRELAREFVPGPPALTDGLTYCDMTTSPDGVPVAVEHRLAEIHSRYGPDHLVSRSITAASPVIRGAVERTANRLVPATVS